MPETVGRSVYLSETDDSVLSSSMLDDAPVFLSLHRQEEMDGQYAEKMKAFLEKLHEKRCRIIADISKRTLGAFGVSSEEELMDLLFLYAVRLDYGYDMQEILRLSKTRNVVINASTLRREEYAQLSGQDTVIAMHNFYPRPETGLDEDQLRRSTDLLHSLGIKVWAFIPGTGRKRGPLYLGLPTLESHRNLPPYAAFADLLVHYGMDEVFVGDPEIDPEEERRMERFAKEGILEIPCILKESCADLYDRIFTCRIDSPTALLRVSESREYSIASGKAVPAEDTDVRIRGSITMDNEAYLRYCGEIMIVRKDLPKDDRVNVIGHVNEAYISLPDCVENGAKFSLVRL